MTYLDWLRQVDDALRANQRGFTYTSIDPADLQSAFASGQSPVIYARGAVPSPQLVYQQRPGGQPYAGGQTWANQVPLPNTFACSLTCRSLTVVGWLIWVIGFANFLLLIFATTAGGVNQKDVTAFSMYVSGMIIFYPFVLLALIIWFAIGGICHWFSQMLAITYHRQ